MNTEQRALAVFWSGVSIERSVPQNLVMDLLEDEVPEAHGQDGHLRTAAMALYWLLLWQSVQKERFKLFSIW